MPNRMCLDHKGTLVYYFHVYTITGPIDEQGPSTFTDLFGNQFNALTRKEEWSYYIFHVYNKGPCKGPKRSLHLLWN